MGACREQMGRVPSRIIKRCECAARDENRRKGSCENVIFELRSDAGLNTHPTRKIYKYIRIYRPDQILSDPVYLIC